MRSENRVGFTQHLWHVAGLFLILEAGAILFWNKWTFWNQAIGSAPYHIEGWLFLSILAAAYIGALQGAQHIASLPRCGRLGSVLASTSICFSAAILAIFLIRSYYSRPFLLFAFAASVVWIYLGLRFFFSAENVRYGFTPGTVIRELEQEWRSNFFAIPSPDTEETYDVLVVAPYQEKKLSGEWIRYITNMLIQGMPMVHPGTVYEFFTGRLPIEYMTEGPGVVFHPPRVYPTLKRVVDWTITPLIVLPATVCMMLIAAAALLASGAPIFFVQERIGKNGVPFKMYKFRSMTEDGEVTKLGRYLRKYRLDELPQILNVIKGEMSYIGPRPELPELTRRYTEEIPFYPYRYSILPGITGWAQVNYGYAAVTSENRIKLGYDLYYIKHASFILDMLIVVKTVKAIVTGLRES